MSEISPAQFKKEWDEGRRPVLIDVRQPDEWEICNLQEFGAKLIPLGEIPQKGCPLIVESGARRAGCTKGTDALLP